MSTACGNTSYASSCSLSARPQIIGITIAIPTQGLAESIAGKNTVMPESRKSKGRWLLLCPGAMNAHAA
ncbi:MAG: hypothetical protein WC360_07485 [Opitutales bacterium]